ncbi:hypothetical protein Pla123a_04780 [Posidoniimonas polymericola]|uniref:Uncharacterized protein n=1 Tax=Posidoniimonas polymericola TaxID=2528002 RepID=A0A5C5ZFQ0_9BACT|nr:hypothetical protein [Posidoniimonas polymericola]TWT85671.1 hypothetical protein Pla123a_04780 [Posidoniimonas polymericola]
MPKLSVATLVALFLALSPSSPTLADPTPVELQQRAPGLIKQLGSEQYAERRAAQRDLADIGLAAFDVLYAARENEDLEIASTAERLLSEMTIYWSQPGDSARVRDSLEDYGRLDVDERADTVAELGGLGQREGLAPLCRVARFDLSERVAAKGAALAMYLSATEADSLTGQQYRVPEDARRRLRLVLDELTQDYGPSTRQATRWLQRFVDQADQPAEAADAWRRELATLQSRIEAGQSDVEPNVLDSLYWNLLRVELQAGKQQAAAATARWLAAENASAAAGVLQRAFDWMDQAGADATVDSVLTGRPVMPYLETQPGLYLAAGARRKQGREQEAQQLADQAFAVGPQPRDNQGRQRPLFDGRVIAGDRLRQEGQIDWAERELRAAIEESGLLSADGAYAAWLLSDLLQDDNQPVEAAAVLKSLLAEIQLNEENQNQYQQLTENRSNYFRPLAELSAYEAYYRALAHRDAGEASAERAALLEAFGHDPTNADIPIAMHRASRPGEEYRTVTVEHIHTLADALEEQIDQDPSNSQPYNQWAWLIANTEGDFDKAVRYSLRSLEISKQNPGYLDTLGRCYYAAGDLEKAVETQRRAVELSPQYKVMQRQLEFFEQELSKQKQ